jgi:lysophospholipase L1-like esterase
MLLITTVFHSRPPKRIIFFGDSITQMGTNPGGYIRQLESIFLQKGLASKYELLGAGVGYNKVYDLYLRMETDVLDKHPDLVLIYVGINDVGHKYSTRTGTDLDKYEAFYTAIIRKLQLQQIEVVLCTPSVLGEKKDNANPADAELDQYAAVVRKLAASQHCKLIDLRRAFQLYENTNNTSNLEKGLLTTDGIHLTEAGNQLVANEIFQGIPLQ